MVYGRRYATLMWDHVQRHNLTSDTHKNQGEDIYFSYLVMSASGKMNRCHAAHGLPNHHNMDAVSLSARPKHGNERTKVMQRCRNHFI